MEGHREVRYQYQDEPISLDELKSFLWGAATRLRGQIDAAVLKEKVSFIRNISPVPKGDRT